MTHPRSPAAAIRADEIGIEYARSGEFVVKTAYQPVFFRHGDALIPGGVEAMARPSKFGAAEEIGQFLETADSRDRAFLESVFRRLHIGNLRNIGVDCLRLFMNCETIPDARPAESLAALAELADELAIDRESVCLEIVAHHDVENEVLGKLADAMREQQFRIALDDFGAGNPDLERMQVIDPDVVKIDGAWFRRISEAHGAAKLLGALVAQLRDNGAEVLIQGIETAPQLAAALDTGADLFQGFHLGRPALAGAMFDENPRDIARLLERKAQVIPLFG